MPSRLRDPAVLRASIRRGGTDIQVPVGAALRPIIRTRDGLASTIVMRSESHQGVESEALQELKLRKCGSHGRPSALSFKGRIKP